MWLKFSHLNDNFQTKKAPRKWGFDSNDIEKCISINALKHDNYKRTPNHSDPLNVPMWCILMQQLLINTYASQFQT